MNNKKWLYLFFSISFISLIGISSFNYYIDPTWMFTHSNKHNQKQNAFNERQQKTNHVYFNGLDNYDGILLGSSRAAYINQNEFKGMKIYNYAVNAMYLYEYKPYIDFSKEIKGKDLDYIILGLDFYSTSTSIDAKSKSPEIYIKNVKSSFYKYKTLFSYDSFKYSKDNLKSKKKRYYDRNNIKHHELYTEEKRKNKFKRGIKKHLKKFDSNIYSYNENYKGMLLDIKKSNPNSKIIVYTSPITSELLMSILKKKNRASDYERWVNEIVDVFGSFNHFMNINSITTNFTNYPDDDHLYPHKIKYIANKLTGFNLGEIPDDFGTIINKNNIGEFFNKFKHDLNNYKLLEE